jgi:XTP/dITP diphosphohydrolase
LLFIDKDIAERTQAKISFFDINFSKCDINVGGFGVMNATNQWVLASHNAGKLKELRSILTPFGIAMTSAGELGLDEPDETEPTFIGNAQLKAEAAFRATGLPCLADDSGLVVNALGDQPGIYSARWAGEPRDFGRAMQRVRDEMVQTGSPDQTARFVCVIALAHADGPTRIYEGEVCGQIVWPPRGAGGFGYDPIFQPDGETRTFGEMQPVEKKALSHRGRALGAMIAAELAR